MQQQQVQLRTWSWPSSRAVPSCFVQGPPCHRNPHGGRTHPFLLMWPHHHGTRGLDPNPFGESHWMDIAWAPECRREQKSVRSKQDAGSGFNSIPLFFCPIPRACSPSPLLECLSRLRRPAFNQSFSHAHRLGLD